MEKKKPQVVFVPDVHGRRFWKNAVKLDCNIVFLGDYLDPYTDYEGITKEDAFDNFLEIVGYAKKSSNVKLLLGNHDLEYAVGTNICECRCDYKKYDEIQNIFRTNRDLFNLTHFVENEKLGFVAISHAGVTKQWLDEIGEKNIVDVFKGETLNTKYKNNDYGLFSALANVSFYRGGLWNSGSVVWADVREHANDKNAVDVFQVFGHTMLKEMYVCDRFACLDVQRCVALFDDGTFEYIQ